MTKQEELTAEEKKHKEFMEDIEKIYRHHGLALVFVPAWRMSQDNGDYRLVIETRIAELPKEVK